MYIFMYTRMTPRSTEQVLKTTTLKKCKNHKNKRLLSFKAAASKKSKFYNSIRYISSKASLYSFKIYRTLKNVYFFHVST